MVRDKLKGLVAMGVDCFKTDFGDVFQPMFNGLMVPIRRKCITICIHLQRTGVERAQGHRW